VVEVIDGLSVVNLSKLMELKLASSRGVGRRKDLGDAQEMIRTLKLPLEFRERLDSSLRELYEELWRELDDATRQQAAPDADD
jgi:hypothetical protein